MVVEDLEEDPILRFAARRDTNEFFVVVVLEKEVAREEENARSERDVDEVNMMTVLCCVASSFFSYRGALLKIFFAAL